MLKLSKEFVIHSLRHTMLTRPPLPVPESARRRGRGKEPKPTATRERFEKFWADVRRLVGDESTPQKRFYEALGYTDRKSLQQFLRGEHLRSKAGKTFSKAVEDGPEAFIRLLTPKG